MQLPPDHIYYCERHPLIPCKTKSDVATMQVSYNGFTGELVRLKRHTVVCCAKHYIYDLSIYDSEKHVTHSFTGVKLEDVKFLGEAVSFGG